MAHHNPLIAYLIWGAYTLTALSYLAWQVHRGQKN